MKRLRNLRSNPLAACWAVAVFCLAMIAILWGTITVHVRSEESRLIDAKLAENANLTRLLAAHTRNTLRAAEQAMLEVERRYRRSGRSFDLVSFWRQRELFRDPANVVGVIDGRGERVLTSRPNAKPQNYFKSPMVQYHLKNPRGGLRLSPPTLGRASGKWTVYLSRRLAGPDDRFDGVVVYGLNPAYFGQLFRSIDLGADAVITLVGRDGIVRARNKDEATSAGHDLRKAPLFTRLLPRSDFGSAVGISPLDGVARLLSYQALKNYPVIVALATTQDAAVAPFADRKKAFYAAGAAIFVLIMILGLVTIRMIQRAEKANTARSEAVIAARRVERDFLDAIEELPVMVALYDRHGRLVHFNRAFAVTGTGSGKEKISRGMSFEEVMRVRVAQGFVPERAKTDPEGWIAARLARQDMDSEMLEFDCDGRSFEIRDVELTGGSTMVLVTDITARKESENEVRRLNAVLEQRVADRTAKLRAAQSELVRSERLATLGELAATVSHELRNPLAAIGTSAAVVEAKVKGRGLRLEQTLARIQRSIGRCDRIISEMLDFARERELILVPTDLDRWLAELLEEQTMPANIRVRLEGHAGEMPVHMDPELFRRAIINLVENARDALQNADPPSLAGEILVETAAIDGHVTISVIDNGPGMAAEIQDNAGEPLFSTKAFGVGLGLPVVQKIVTQHNGVLRIDSEPGKGTRATITIPRHQAPESAVEAARIA